MDDNHQTPTLRYFRQPPTKMRQQPPLGSSLQSLESCFELIAVDRYPHALISCTSAIESAIKAALRKRPDSKDGLKTLILQAHVEHACLPKPDNSDLDQLRKLRNELVHYGYSPQHDELAASSLLTVGFRYLGQCYQTFFEFDLINNLRIECASHLTRSEPASMERRPTACAAS